MSYIPKTISEVVSEFLNRTTFLPAIQREYVWGTYAIEKLFDSIMGDFPISTFLFWKIKEENKSEWVAYEFIRDYDAEAPHNKEASVKGINQDIYFVLDGQQRLTSLFIGLKGSYRYFYYRWHKTRLYLNLLKEPIKDDNPEELTYQFKFRADAQPDPRDSSPQYWYLVGDILNFDDAEDAKRSIKQQLAGFSDHERDIANSHIGRLHSRISTARLLNYYEEKSQDYDKVVEAFIRANTGGVKLEYSDILLSTATAKWANLNAREEIHSFTDDLNAIGNGYSFGKDFVLKGCLYLTEGLPIQYKVKNFNRTNLEKIENAWPKIKDNLEEAIQLASRFGFSDKNIVSKIALLPIAYYLGKLGAKHFVTSSNKEDVRNQLIMQKWLALVLLKNAFGGSSDTTLTNLQQVINEQPDFKSFPYEAMNKRLNIEASFTDSEIENLLATNYSTKYSYLILALLYPERDWKDKNYHEDHVFPKSEFTNAKLKARGYDDAKIAEYQKWFNCILNLELLTDRENLEKSAEDFGDWFASRDANFKDRHAIPTLESYDFDSFLEFIEKRRTILARKLKAFSI
ncbi:MAG: DUF262 domain-containing protein [Verrucomicrobiaceae bacterium]|nr:DUF262 domain-containing protein [Verrucomicrobiaceae bacterium]